MNIQIKKLHESAKVPTYAHTTDAAMDLCSVEDIVVPPKERVAIHSGLAMAIPEGYVGLIWDKSGVAVKGGLTTIAGVIDAGYRGEILIAIYNTTDEPYTFNVGDKVAQMVIQKIEQPTFEEVDELPEADRGDAGFGSTGK